MAKLGIQLYTVMDAANKEYFGTIRELRGMGYEGIEFPGGTMERSPADRLRTFLEELDFELAGIVFDDADFRNRFDEVLKYCKQVRCTTVVHPYLPKEFLTPDGLIKFANDLNDWGKQFAHHGIGLLYHVHGHEFVDFGGKSGMEIIIDHLTDAKLEIDVYWVEHAGVDSIEFFRKYGHLSPSIHFKDMSDRQTKGDTEVGTGCIDMNELARLGNENNARWFIVEQEAFKMSSMQSAEISRNNLWKIMGR